MSLAATSAFDTLTSDERAVALRAALALKETQRQQLRSLEGHQRVATKSADDVVRRAGLSFLRELAVLRAALDHATREGWYQPAAYAHKVNGGRSESEPTHDETLECQMAQMDTEVVKDAIRDLLRTDDRSTSKEIRAELTALGHATNTNLPKLVTEVRKEMGIQGKPGMRSKLKRRTKKKPRVRPPAERTEVTQPTEKDDETPSPPSAPGAAAADLAESVARTVAALRAELDDTRRRAREIEAAVDALEKLTA